MSIPVEEDQFEDEEELERQPSAALRIFRGVVAVAVMVGLVYFSGVYQYFFFSRTSPDIEQRQTQTAIDAQVIMVPLTIFIVQSSGAFGSERTQEDAERMVAEADKIWQQANIRLDIQEIYTIQQTDQEIQTLYSDARAFARNIGGLEAGTINVVLVGNLQGLNGVAFGGIPLVAVADYTSVFDFRVLAHEIGHKLGLPHVGNETRLMHQGANSFLLSLEEIATARGFAEQFE